MKKLTQASDASQDIKDAVANLDPGIRKRINESLKIDIPPNHSFSSDVSTCVGIVHDSENFIKTSRQNSAIDREASE